MNADKLVAALTLIFVVSVILLVGELLFLLLRRRRRFTPPQNPKNHPTELLYNFFSLKSRTRVEPSGAPNGYSPDVLKPVEANGPSRILCTIKEDDRELEVESTTSVSVEIPLTQKVCLLTCPAKVDVESPVFFTPVGSPVSGSG